MIWNSCAITFIFVPMAVIFMAPSLNTQHNNNNTANSNRIIHVHARKGNDSEDCLKGQEDSESNQYC